MHIGDTPDLFLNLPPDHGRKPAAKGGAMRRDIGIERAAAHAERVAAGWQEEARAMIHAFARCVRTFTAEEARAFAYLRGLPRPPDEHAWGGPMIRARKAGWIEPVGIEEAKAEHVHRGRVMRWRSMLFQGGA